MLKKPKVIAGKVVVLDHSKRGRMTCSLGGCKHDGVLCISPDSPLGLVLENAALGNTLEFSVTTRSGTVMHKVKIVEIDGQCALDTAA